ncbi:unnamed protein product [Rotaria socialis]|uniref:Uncharacterized protein n=1 Tax=Rotaria socialis TaxID=392032 RepID=A0A817S6F5_9BILA|nr:unnamed protein product [Rotaria socialis]CAF3596166.1 unnamed protein product [Rotaria socialis]CAF4159671.1 unnamed protein product [Rotaria socialis]CAF4324698.1 unnamed protein product [Rotaria socialis]
MIDRLTANGTYSCIGSGNDRPNNRGGNFEVYKSDLDDDAKVTAVNSVLENENFLFIAVGRQSLNNPILQKTNRKSKKFLERKYLIREKNTLRAANSDEEEQLSQAEANKNERNRADSMQNLRTTDDIASMSTDGIDEKYQQVIIRIMQNSYGRMAMAYQRARNRYHELVNMYNEIFNFELQTLPLKKELNIESYLTVLDPCEKYYKVTVKDKYRQNLPLKKVFEVLQVYNSSEDDIINGTIPLLINLNIGGRETEFMLSQWPSQYEYTKKNQLLVSTKVESTANNLCFKGRAYDKLVIDFNYEVARYMIDCLSVSIAAQPRNFREANEKFTQIVEFLAHTDS